MRIYLSQLIPTIARSEHFPKLFLIENGDGFFTEEAKNSIFEFAKKHSFNSIETIYINDVADVHKLVPLLFGSSFFEEKIIVDIRLSDAMRGSRSEAKEKEENEFNKDSIATKQLKDENDEINTGGSIFERTIGQYIDNFGTNLRGDRVVVISVNKIGNKVLVNKFWKKIDKYGIVVNIYPPNKEQMATWIRNQANYQGINISKNGIESLVEYTFPNLANAKHELDKLIGIYFSKVDPLIENKCKILNDEQILASVNNFADLNQFSLIDSLHAADVKRFIFTYLTLRQNNDDLLHLILWSISNEIRILLDILFISNGFIESAGNCIARVAHKYCDDKKINKFQSKNIIRFYEKYSDYLVQRKYRYDGKNKFSTAIDDICRKTENGKELASLLFKMLEDLQEIDSMMKKDNVNDGIVWHKIFGICMNFVNYVKSIS